VAADLDDWIDEPIEVEFVRAGKRAASLVRPATRWGAQTKRMQPRSQRLPRRAW
jgi:hypothetical protein